MTAPLIAIVGSYDPKRTDELSLKNIALAQEAGAELGRELARQGCNIVVYASYPYLLEVDVVRGYVEVKKAQPEPEPECIQVRFSNRLGRPVFNEENGNRELFHFIPDNNAEWEVSFYRSLREVDGVLVLGGGPSSMIAGVIAVGHRKPIVVSSYFGGYAEKIWDLLPSQQTLLTERELSLMADNWDSGLAERYVQILIRQIKQLEDEEKDLAAKAKLKEEEMVAQYNQRLEAALKAERDTRKSVKVYAVISMLAFLLALGMWVVALGRDDVQGLWLVIFLAVAPLAAGVSAATIRVVFDARPGQPEQPAARAPSVIANTAMGLVGGGITAVLYVLTQLIAIGGTPQRDQYVRLIPFALATGFVAGFALDVVERKLRERAESGVGSAFGKQ
jgi:hypothetical protein